MTERFLFKIGFIITARVLIDSVIKSLFISQAAIHNNAEPFYVIDLTLIAIVKVGLSPSKRVVFIYFNEALKNEEKCFLFHINKDCFRS